MATTFYIKRKLNHAFVFIFIGAIYFIGGSIAAVPVAVMVLLIIYALIIKRPLNKSIESAYQAAAHKNAVLIEIGLSENLLPYIIEKGSVSIDGISLTVASVTKRSFIVSVIPHTKKMTTLEKAMPGQMVNIECDMIGKYIQSFFANFNSFRSHHDCFL